MSSSQEVSNFAGAAQVKALPMYLSGPGGATGGKKLTTVNVVLIHGTFAPEARWTADNSSFRQKLSRGLADEGVSPQFNRFQWKGAVFGPLNNSHRARIAASIRLAAFVDELRRHSSAPVVLIGHSHGGNVALYACRHLRTQPAGVACLSTPFVICERTKLRTKAMGLVGLVAAGLMTACLTLVWLTARAWSTHEGLGERDFVIAGFLGFVAATLISVFDMTRAIDKIESVAARLRNELTVPVIENKRLFIAGTAWDEAAAALTLAGLFSSLPRRLWNEPVAKKLLVWLLLPSTVASAIWFSDLFTGRWLSLTRFVIEGMMTVLMAAVVVLLTFFALFAGSIVLAVGANLSLKAWAFGFGRELLLTSFVVQVSVRKTPLFVSRWRGYILAGQGLVHSRIYDSDAVIADLAEWIGDLTFAVSH